MKTIEEAAKNYAISRHVDLVELKFVGKYQQAFKAGIDFAQRWIPVEEELPEMCEQVLVKMLIKDTIHYRCASIFYCENGVKLWSASGHFYPCRNTWWRLINLK